MIANNPDIVNTKEIQLWNPGETTYKSPNIKGNKETKG